LAGLSRNADRFATKPETSKINRVPIAEVRLKNPIGAD
jgi:hypothetical protein